MNKRIDFSYNGGFPATQYTVNYMQESYREAFAGLAGMIGDKVILTGVEVVGGQVTNGWISLGGELLPFVGGPIGDTVIIEEVPESRLFEDNQSKAVYFSRVARFGSPGGFPFSDLKRPGTIKEVWQRGDLKMVHCTMDYLAANFDSTGLGINERKGWAVCNGQNGTENMGGRFPVGYDPNSSEVAEIKNLFGSSSFTIETKNLPSFSISTTRGITKRGAGGDPNEAVAAPGGTNFGGTFTDTIQFTGQKESIANKPPAVVTLFIMKL